MREPGVVKGSGDDSTLAMGDKGRGYTVKCYKCGEIGHMRRDCKVKGKGTKVCYRCRSKDHVIADCTAKVFHADGTEATLVLGTSDEVYDVDALMGSHDALDGTLMMCGEEVTNVMDVGHFMMYTDGASTKHIVKNKSYLTNYVEEQRYQKM